MVFVVKIVALLEQYALKEVLVLAESLDITLRTRNMKQASRWYKNGWFALSCNQFQIWKSVHQEQEENKSCFHNRSSTMVSYCMLLCMPSYKNELLTSTSGTIISLNWDEGFATLIDLTILCFVFFHQEFKVLILSFAVFVVVASGATVYKSRADEKKVRWQADTFWCTYCFSNFIPVMVY